MQLAKCYKIEKAASKDEDRIEINHVFVRKDCTAMATDGRIMAIVPCAVGDGEKPGPVTVDSIVYARKHSLGDEALLLHLVDDTTAIAEDTTVFPREMSFHTEGEGTQLELIRDGKMDTEGIARRCIETVPAVTDEYVTVTVNAKLLLNLAEALGDKDKITLFMLPDGKDKIVRTAVRVHGMDGAIGVIMPMRPESD